MPALILYSTDTVFLFIQNMITGCGFISYWRRVSYRLLNQKLGKQRHCSESLIFWTFHSFGVSELSIWILCQPSWTFNMVMQIKPRYAFNRKEIRPGEFQVFLDVASFIFAIYSYIVSIFLYLVELCMHIDLVLCLAMSL